MALSPYRQFILIDCDGGRSALFDDRSLLNQLPTNCELYLFWNKTDKIIDDKLNSLQTTYQHIHCCPSTLTDMKNSADGKLIYFLGKFVDKYSTILLVTGSDKIYKEVVQCVKEDYHTNKIEVKEISSPNNQSFKDILNRLHQLNEKHGYSNSADVHHLSTFSMPSSSEKNHFLETIKQCPHCLKTFTAKGAVKQHIASKHPTNASSKAVVSKQFTLVSKTEKCPNCSKHFKSKEDVHQHMIDKHKDIVRITCTCSAKDLTIQEYNQHRPLNQPKYPRIVDKNGLIPCTFGHGTTTRLILYPDMTPFPITSGKTNSCPVPNCRCKSKYKPTKITGHLAGMHKEVNIRVQCCDPTGAMHTIKQYLKHLNVKHLIAHVR